MKRKIVYAEAILLSLAAAWSAVGCLVTAFDLPVVLDERIGLLWLAVCLASLLLFSLRRGGLAVVILTALGIAAAWHRTQLGTELRNVLGWIVRVYDHAYGWGIPGPLRDIRGGGTLPLALLGILMIESVVCTVFRRKGSPLAVALLVIPLTACLVVTDTVPQISCLFVLLLCLILLLLTDSVRSESGDQGSRLAMGAAIPTALVLGLLFYFTPQNRFQNSTEELRRQILAFAQDFTERVQSGELGLPNYSGRRDRVDLTALASQPQLGLPVAEIAAEVTGPVYLRVQDYDVYTGSEWRSSPSRQEALSGTGDPKGAVVVREISSQGRMLLPSYPSGNTVLSDGMAVSENGEKVYRFDCVASAMSATPEGTCLTLPEGTGVQVRALLQQIPGDMSGVESTAEAIGNYVRGSALYNRRTGPMPSDSSDFALWFLERADSGYCVHFATAAVVLLRSAGIPARYVTGYKADAVAGETVKVTSDDAHAWAEYYNYKTWAWSILEATPGELSLTPETTAPETTQEIQSETVPANTTAATAPTHPPQTQPELPPEEHWKLPAWIPVTVFSAILAWGAVELQRTARIRFRHRRQQNGPANRRAIARWEEICLLHRLLGRPLPEELSELAEKAMFSQHSLTREELTAFAASAQFCRHRLRTRPWHRRLVYRYWHAVI